MNNTINLNELLTDKKYRELSVKELASLIRSEETTWACYNQLSGKFSINKAKLLKQKWDKESKREIKLANTLMKESDPKDIKFLHCEDKFDLFKPNSIEDKSFVWWKGLTLPQRSKLLHTHYISDKITKSDDRIEEMYLKEMALPICTICGKPRKPLEVQGRETIKYSSLIVVKLKKQILKKDVVRAQNLIKAYEKQETKKKELKPMYLVEVLQSSGVNYWYRKHIGEKFKVVQDPKDESDYMLITGGSYLVKTDCKIIKKYSKKVSLKK